ncbi:MAG: hypothetical protein GY829_13235, partial [Gammaproteobacteria bacterium]|nr:hypothetical protein [Gammaproteobacteria bacterium]
TPNANFYGGDVINCGIEDTYGNRSDGVVNVAVEQNVVTVPTPTSGGSGSFELLTLILLLLLLLQRQRERQAQLLNIKRLCTLCQFVAYRFQYPRC